MRLCKKETTDSLLARSGSELLLDLEIKKIEMGSEILVPAVAEAWESKKILNEESPTLCVGEARKK